MRVFLGQPQYPGSARPDSILAAVVFPSEEHKIEYTPVCSTGTAKGFNLLWADALGRAERGEIDYFAMLHADVVPENFWVDKLIAECERLGADVISSLIAIKDPRGLASAGVDWFPNDPWQVKRLTFEEIMQLPETFSTDDVTAAGLNPNQQPLLVNTGCWVADMRKPFWLEHDDRGICHFFFTLNDQIVRKGPGKYAAQTESEDWFFSRRLAGRAGKYYTTRKVVVKHYGDFGYPNNLAWGQCKTDESRPEMIAAHGFWTQPTVNLHKFDKSLADQLCGFLGTDSVLDLGCGRGDYVLRFREAGIPAAGIDGNPHTEDMSGGICTCGDLAEPVNGDAADWVLSLEVAEHIPQEFEPAYLNNLDRHNRKGIILSWATPGQGGTGHFNERPPEYVTEKFAALGYLEDIAAASTLREVSTLPWFRKNLRVFRRPAAC